MLTHGLWMTRWPAAGAQATVELVDGAGHMFPELDEAATTRVVERSVRFLCSPVSV